MHGATARTYDFYYARPELKLVEAEQKNASAKALAAKKRVKSRRKSHHGVSIIMKSGILLFGLALLLVYLCIRSSVLNYQIIALERENSRLETERMRLEYQIAQQQSLDHIAELAALELNMVKPGLETSYVVPMTEEAWLIMADSGEVEAVAGADMEEKRGLGRLYDSLVSLAAGQS